jgi:hypothetical protein
VVAELTAILKVASQHLGSAELLRLSLNFYSAPLMDAVLTTDSIVLSVDGSLRVVMFAFVQRRLKALRSVELLRQHSALLFAQTGAGAPSALDRGPGR